MSTAAASARPRDAATRVRWDVRLAWAHGVFFFVSGLWPILHMPSFVAVTGPKTDLWLVRTVGGLLAAFGAALLLVARRARMGAEWIFLAMAMPLVLALIDVVYVARGVIRPIYLADAAVEFGLVIAWLAVAVWRKNRTE